MAETVQAETQRNSGSTAWDIARRRRGLETEPVTMASTSTTVTGSTSTAQRLALTGGTAQEA